MKIAKMKSCKGYIVENDDIRIIFHTFSDNKTASLPAVFLETGGITNGSLFGIKRDEFLDAWDELKTEG